MPSAAMRRPFASIWRNAFAAAVLTALISSTPASAQEPGSGNLQVGVGDMLFETAVWSATVPKPGITNLRERVRYTPHIFLNYSWKLTDWFSAGWEMDFQHTDWQSVTRDAENTVTATQNENFFNLCIGPVLRFNYCRLEHFSMYSSLSAGIDINGGSQTDELGRRTVVGVAANIRLIGLKAGAGRWWGFVDAGCLAGMRDRDHIFMFGSSLVRAGLEISL